MYKQFDLKERKMERRQQVAAWNEEAVCAIYILAGSLADA